MHKSITLDRVMAVAEASMFGMEDDGFCTACGADAMGVEPDARKYECEACGELAVYGAEEVLLFVVG